MGGAAQAMKRIPLIKFPQRHPKSSGSQNTYISNNTRPNLFPSSATSSVALGGKASSQLKRTPMSQEEIDSVLLGGCI